MAAESALNLQRSRRKRPTPAGGPAARGRPFPKGQSGNPAGKPKGTRNRTTVIAQALLDGEAQALVRKAIDSALEGDPVCLKICLERLVPLKREAPIATSLPEVGAVADIQKLFAAVAAGLDQGAINLSEAGTLIDFAEAFRKALEVVELERPLCVLEEKCKRRDLALSWTSASSGILESIGSN